MSQKNANHYKPIYNYILSPKYILCTKMLTIAENVITFDFPPEDDNDEEGLNMLGAVWHDGANIWWSRQWSSSNGDPPKGPMEMEHIVRNG